jgi:hypothetical protein
MTPGTLQRAAFQKNRCADTRPIVHRESLDIKNHGLSHLSALHQSLGLHHWRDEDISDSFSPEPEGDGCRERLDAPRPSPHGSGLNDLTAARSRASAVSSGQVASCDGREGEAPAEPQERQPLRKTAQHELRPPAENASFIIKTHDI